MSDIWGNSDVYRTYKEGTSLPPGCTGLVWGQPLKGRNHDDPLNPKLEPLPVAWFKNWQTSDGKSARVDEFVLDPLMVAAVTLMTDGNRDGFAEVSFIQEDKPAQTFLLHSLKLVWRPTRSGDFFKAFDGEIAVGVGHVVADARAIEQGR